MFKLQRLEITGFKSFADHTEVVFTGNGITAVVGPNGCGKSNVSDAMAWVLGEQRAKSLRGAEMKDVVFQGTKTRKPSGMAEVVLHLVRDEMTFDAEDGELEEIDEALSNIDELAVDVDALEGFTNESDFPEIVAVEAVESVSENGAENGFHVGEVEIEEVQVAAAVATAGVGAARTIKTKRHWRPRSFALDFAPGEAVSVSRRLYLSGESEYLLNGKSCRLRDIQDLFAGTGLSGAHYAIIEQGRIGQILSAKPADRRSLIEEAAGISKFRTRQRAAESRLDSAKTNLGRISDIVSEIEKQANSLRRQAAKTRRFVALQDEFRVLLRQLFAAEGKHLAAAIEDLTVQLKGAVDHVAECSLAVTSQEDAVKQSTQLARDTEEALAEVRRGQAEAALERDRVERERRYQTEQIEDLRNRISNHKREMDAAAERMQLAASEKERLEKEEAAEGEQADASRMLLAEAEKSYSDLVEEVRGIESELEIERSELMRHTSAIERLGEVERQLNQNLERLEERARGLELEEGRAKKAHEEHVAEVERLVSEIGGEREKLGQFEKEKEVLTAAIVAAREALSGSEQQFATAEGELQRVQNRLETLEELEDRRAVYSPEIQKLFSERDDIGVEPLGVLADFLNVAESAETAVESLFGPYLQSVIVNSADEAAKIADWSRRSGAGRVAILIAPGLEKSNAKRATENSSDVLAAMGVEGSFADLLKSAFPREASAHIVDDLSSIGGREGVHVARNGDILFGGALYISGVRAEGSEGDSLLAFKRELVTLAERVKELSANAELARKKAQSDRQVLAEVEEKTVDLQSLVIKVERHLIALELEEKTARHEIERAERHQKVVAAEREQSSNESAEIRKRIDEALESRRTAETMLGEVRSKIEGVNLRLTTARQNAEIENGTLNDRRTLAATSSERRRAVQSALKRIENEQRELELRSSNIARELEEAEKRLVEVAAALEITEQRIAGMATEIEAEGTELEVAIAAVAAARGNADLASSLLAERNRAAGEAMNERAAIEVRQAEASTRLENIRENCTQDLHCSLDELIASEAISEDFELEAARGRSEELRERLDGFGAINMLAVEELAAAEERLLFLSSQRQDIIESIASAEEALREIKTRSRERFVRAFEAINANFKEFFSELFGGGSGEMTLLESDDVLEAGIEVAAQPPGKRLQNILLLSGGEKAMTAIALVMAIFKYRPSPFCLLDEVDAPLDEANVGRFVNKIAEMAEKTQFIIITHNKRTMEAARALYGVTMQEAGVSKVVSVRFE